MTITTEIFLTDFNECSVEFVFDDFSLDFQYFNSKFFKEKRKLRSKKEKENWLSEQSRKTPQMRGFVFSNIWFWY